MREVLEEDHDCEWLLEWVDGCAELDQRIFSLVLEAEQQQTVDDIAAAVDRDRSTTYRAVRRLHDQGYLDRERHTYDNGGYCYAYDTSNPDEIAAHLEETIAAAHRELESLIEEFRDVYCENSQN